MFSAELRPLFRSTLAAMAACGGGLVAVQLTGSAVLVRGPDASGPRPVPLGAVLLATAAGGVAALVLVRLANRTVRPRSTFGVAVTVGLVLSCVPPLQAATTTRAGLVLVAMHLVVAALVVPPAARLLQPGTWNGTSPAQRRRMLRPKAAAR